MNSCELIYNFSKSKINLELQMILRYLTKKVDRLDVTQVDIVEDALSFKELEDKAERLKVRGSTEEVEKGESLQGIAEIIKALA